MDKTYPTGSLAERRVTIWMRIHERMLEEQRRFKTERVRVDCAHNKDPFQRAA